MTTFFSEAFLLALLTLLAYSYAYAFEAGFALNYGYPAALIGPTLHSFFGAWAVLLLLAVSLFFHLNLQYWPHENHWKASFIIVLVLFILATLTVIAFIPTFAIPIAMFISSTLAITAQGVYLSRKSARSHSEQQSAASNESEFSHIFTTFDRRSEVPRHSIAYAILKRYNLDPLVYFILFLLVIPGICFYAGFTQGKTQTEFYLISNFKSDLDTGLAVRILSDVVIGVPYNADESTYVQDFTVLRLSELDQRTLQPIRIPHLTISDYR